MIWAVSLSTMKLIPHSLTPVLIVMAFRVSIGKVSLRPLNQNCALPPQQNPTRLYLNIFRGEPAISQFDQPFTPIHTSSEYFSTHTGSDLHPALPGLHLGHGQLTRFRVYHILLNALFRLAFATAPFFQNLTSQYMITRWLIMQKVRSCAYVYIASTDCRHLVSGSISLPSRGSFNLSLTVLVRYRSLGSIQPYPVVRADSYEISRAPQYLGN